MRERGDWMTGQRSGQPHQPARPAFLFLSLTLTTSYTLLLSGNDNRAREGPHTTPKEAGRQCQPTRVALSALAPQQRPAVHTSVFDQSVCSPGGQKKQAPNQIKLWGAFWQTAARNHATMTTAPQVPGTPFPPPFSFASLFSLIFHARIKTSHSSRRLSRDLQANKRVCVSFPSSPLAAQRRAREQVFPPCRRFGSCKHSSLRRPFSLFFLLLFLTLFPPATTFRNTLGGICQICFALLLRARVVFSFQERREGYTKERGLLREQAQAEVKKSKKKAPSSSSCWRERGGHDTAT